MARLRFMVVALLALAFAGSSIQRGRTQYQGSFTTYPTSKPTADDRSCTIYSLNDMGYDANLGKWIAESIPEIIEPSSWQQQGGSGVLRYYAPKNILIVKQSATIQSKVGSFLKELKTSLPTTSATNFAATKSARAGIVPAEHREPALLRTSNPVPESSSYPVPSAVKPPKHLFHFIIRYEGEGIIDDNVVKFMKLQGQAEKPAVAAPVCPAPTTPPVSEAPPAYYSAPAVPATPAPSTTPGQPNNTPKKKKGKKDNKEKTPIVAS